MTDAAEGTPARPVAEAPEAAERRAEAGVPARRGTPRWVDALVMVALAALAMVAVLTVVARGAPLSALDEPSHIDYAWNASQLEIPAAGDSIDPEVIALWNCYGNELLRLPACGTTGPAEAYPVSAAQYNFSHPPLYYLATGFAARAVESVTGWNFVLSARALGAVWLAAGMVVMHLALRRLGVGPALAGSVAALAGMWWAGLTAATIVTNDAPFLLTTALGLLALGGAVDPPGRHRWLPAVLLVALAALAAGVKVMNALPFLAIAGAFVVLALLPERYRPWAGRGWLLATGAAMVAAVGAVYVLWTRFQAGRGDPDWENPVEGVNTQPFTGTPFLEWLPTIPRGLSTMGHTYAQEGVASGELVAFVGGIGSIVGLAAIFVGLAVARRGSALAVIAIAALIGSLGWPLIVQLQSFLSSGGTHYFPRPSARYGATMGFVAFAALALIAQRLRWQGLVIAGCLAVVVTTLVTVVMGPVAGS